MHPHKIYNLEEIKIFENNSFFTDDTVLTISIANSLIYFDSSDYSLFKSAYRKTVFKSNLFSFAKKYPGIGYGQMFSDWVNKENKRPYKSYGNGSAMRVSPIGFLPYSLKEVLKIAKESSVVTHNHKDAIKGALAIVSCIYLSNQGESKEYIKNHIQNKYNYNLSIKLDAIKKYYKFDSSAKGSVPYAIICFLESCDFISTIKNSISIGGDSDTIACMAGGIAQAFYKKIPEDIINKTYFILDMEIKNVIKEFNSKYGIVL